ncbi:hypothetical protein GPX89_10120 [Nocardia sp. ET3-3]|uniref:Uncharacterized protein n=1 Tax=Nocardia terrae TaxID=2675851 RepID=A0A7K1UTB9_9NOCA|nr:hypothetical protein [Nocardia terrae]MVU77594.1 hypothetical protein [Nocardia terrae]
MPRAYKLKSQYFNVSARFASGRAPQLRVADGFLDPTAEPGWQYFAPVDRFRSWRPWPWNQKWRN